MTRIIIQMTSISPKNLLFANLWLESWFQLVHSLETKKLCYRKNLTCDAKKVKIRKIRIQTVRQEFKMPPPPMRTPSSSCVSRCLTGTGANPTTATPFLSNLVLECWERDRDDSDDDVKVTRVLGILTDQPFASSSSSLSQNVPSSSNGNSATIREYSDLKVIGSGSFGTIYSAVEVESRKMVAIKVVSNEYHMYWAPNIGVFYPNS